MSWIRIYWKVLAGCSVFVLYKGGVRRSWIRSAANIYFRRQINPNRQMRKNSVHERRQRSWLIDNQVAARKVSTVNGQQIARSKSKSNIPLSSAFPLTQPEQIDGISKSLGRGWLTEKVNESGDCHQSVGSDWNVTFLQARKSGNSDVRRTK